MKSSNKFFKTILISGGSQGLGAGMVKYCLEKGHMVATLILKQYD